MVPLEELSRALSDDNAEVRRQAVIDMAMRDDAGTMLMRALGDADWRVREEAVRVGVERAVGWNLVGPLVDAVAQGENVGLRNAALDLLGQLGEVAVGALVGALGSVDATARKFVIEALAHSGVPSVVSTLVAELEAAGPNEVASAIDALGAIGGEEAERALSDQLKSSDAFVRMAALDALNRLGASMPWDALEPLLSDRLVFRVALEALGRCGDGRAISPLMDALADRSPRLSAVACTALGRLASEPALRDRVHAAVVSASPEQRARLAELSEQVDAAGHAAAAVELLCLARDPAGLRPMLGLAERRVLGRGVVAAMASWGWDAVRELLEIYRDERQQRGAAALEVASDLAGSLKDPLPEIVASLREHLRKELQGVEPDLLAAAVRCMERWGEAGDARRLVALAGSDHEDVREASRTALEALAERDAGAVADALVGVNPEGTGGAQLAGLIARVAADADVASRLHGALLAADPATRCAAIRGLATHGGAKTAELLALSLTDESAEVQVAAADALGRVMARPDAGEDVAVGREALIAALDAETPAVQAAAARALGAARHASAAPTLERVAREGSAPGRVAAVEALRALRVDSLAQVLKEALADPEPEVVKQALRGLSDLGDSGLQAALLSALDHAAWDVRAAAVGMLAQRLDGKSRSALSARLEHEDDAFVREAITSAIEGEDA